MSSALAAAQSVQLVSGDGAPVPLQGVSAKGRLEGLLFELTVEQRYRNDGERNIEAVFTFPLPLHAVLLGLELEIGKRKLAAVAVEKQEASRRYEKAIDAGDTAVLLEHNGDGLYTVNLGNLMAGERAVIRYRYGQLLDAHRGYVRLTIPTVIAPRYGNPADARLEGAAIPGTDLLAEYPFALQIDLNGLALDAGIRSPSHKLNVVTQDGGLRVALAAGAFLDRDLVVEIPQANLPATALVARDGDDYVVLASTALEAGTAEQRPLALKILIDCSGSMGGDSIAAARRAVLAILDRLSPGDLVSITRFGSTVVEVTEGIEAIDADVLPLMQALVRDIQADLGGTEMAGALQHILPQATPADRTADVILITDGEIHAVANIVEVAARSGHRLSAVAIGAAPNEALARSLADRTGGSCEFVGAGEDAEPAIVRTFKRLRATPRNLANLFWPTTPKWTGPLPLAVFPGDTLHFFAGFAALPEGRMTFQVVADDQHATPVAVEIATQLSEIDLIPRLAAAYRLKTLPESEARALAVRHQLVTEYTSMVVVAQRAAGEKALDLPQTVPVAHMLAAGWGGSATSMIAACVSMDSIAPRELDGPHFSNKRVSASPRLRESNVPMYSRSQAAYVSIAVDDVERQRLIEALARALTAGGRLPTHFRELEATYGVSSGVVAQLGDFVVSGAGTEEQVIAVFLAQLTEKYLHDGGVLLPGLTDVLVAPVLASRSYRKLRKRMKVGVEVAP